jgi:hypothetical protein
MMLTAPDPVASGCPYIVTDVAGLPPTAIDDFVGDLAFTVRKGQQSCRVCGTGGRSGADVRFHQKDSSTGRDLRVWQITATATQGFQAQPVTLTSHAIVH